MVRKRTLVRCKCCVKPVPILSKDNSHCQCVISTVTLCTAKPRLYTYRVGCRCLVVITDADVCTVPTFALCRRLHCADVCTVPTFALCRRLHCADVCTVPTFALCRRLHCADVCTVTTFALCRCLHGADVCTAPTFALRRRLHCADDCTVPTFSLCRRLHCADVCTAPLQPTAPEAEGCGRLQGDRSRREGGRGGGGGGGRGERTGGRQRHEAARRRHAAGRRRDRRREGEADGRERAGVEERVGRHKTQLRREAGLTGSTAGQRSMRFTRRPRVNTDAGEPQWSAGRETRLCYLQRTFPER